MKFGPVGILQAEGTVLAHAVKLPDGRLPKGRLISASDVSAMQAAGLAEVVVARRCFGG